MKISREGIVLIKSFEGFRPRAIRREEGGWVIGYGHTLSAREGATVSEADAELLLRYDLMPVETAVNAAGSAVLNQHQFDAMVSFVHSVGVEPFRSSDVLSHLLRGDEGQAADALMGWPEPTLQRAALRRRAAERALFKANPDAPVAVSDLLATPLDVEMPVASSEEADRIEPATSLPEDGPAETTDPTQANLGAGDSRTAAVSILLGETSDIVHPTFAPAPAAADSPLEGDPAADTFAAPANDVTAEVALPQTLVDPDGSAAEEAREETSPNPATVSETMVPTEADGSPENPVTGTDISPAAVPADRAVFTFKRYSPYNAPMVGPLPFLSPAADRLVQTEVGTPATEPQPAHEPVELPVMIESEPASLAQPVATTTEVEPLVLSAADDAPEPSLTREPWTIEERAELSDVTDGGLFGEDLALTQGGAPILRHGEMEFQAPDAFDWSETGAFVIMGAVGLTAFGAAMAAFRLAAEQSGGDETMIIAWVLALIGAGCVGVSSFNLYRRWGLPGGDN